MAIYCPRSSPSSVAPSRHSVGDSCRRPALICAQSGHVLLLITSQEAGLSLPRGLAEILSPFRRLMAHRCSLHYATPDVHHPGAFKFQQIYISTYASIAAQFLFYLQSWRVTIVWLCIASRLMVPESGRYIRCLRYSKDQSGGPRVTLFRHWRPNFHGGGGRARQVIPRISLLLMDAHTYFTARLLTPVLSWAPRLRSIYQLQSSVTHGLEKFCGHTCSQLGSHIVLPARPETFACHPKFDSGRDPITESAEMRRSRR